VKVNKSINQIITYNNLIYLQAGDKGEFFISNGTTVEPFAKLPETLLNIGSSQLKFTNIVIKDELFYFGVYTTGTTVSPIGIYSLNPRTRALALAHTLASGQYGDDETITMGGLFNADGILYLSYLQNDGAEVPTIGYKMEYLSTAKATGDKAFFIAQLLQLGGRDAKTSLRAVEIQLTKPQVANDSVKVYHRTAITGSWTQLGSTWDTDSAQSYVFPALDDIENIQFKVVLNNEAEYLKTILY